MKIISRRERKECVSYSRAFSYEHDPNAGFSFDCDEAGNVDVDKLHPNARISYAACLAGEMEIVRGQRWESDGEGGYNPVPGTGERVTVRMVDDGVRTHRHSYVEAAVGECECGAHVTLDGFTNTCDCGRDYSMGGQLLAPREFWGEETGETVDEILSVDAYRNYH